MPDLHIEHRPDKDALIGPINKCIYCGEDSNPKTLTHEHAVPEALGGRIVLLHASCGGCKDKIDRFESRCNNQMFAHARARIGLKKTKARRRRRDLKLKAKIDGQLTELTIPLEGHPTTLNLPIWEPPGFLNGKPPATDFENPQWWMASFDNAAEFQRKIQSIGAGAATVEIMIEGKIVARSFGRLLAKMAHCAAISTFGFETFKPLLLEVILKEDGPIAYFVGGDPEPFPQSNHRGYRLAFQCAQDGQGHCILLCSIRLFAWLENAPTYLIVVGEPKPALTRRLVGSSS